MSDEHFIIEQVAGPPLPDWFQQAIDRFNAEAQKHVRPLSVQEMGDRMAETYGRLLGFSEVHAENVSLSDEGVLTLTVAGRWEVMPEMITVTIDAG